MKIDKTVKPSAPETSRPKSEPSYSSEQERHVKNVATSSDHKFVETGKAQLATTYEIDNPKLDIIKQQIENGEFKIDTDKIAHSIANHYLKR